MRQTVKNNASRPDIGAGQKRDRALHGVARSFGSSYYQSDSLYVGHHEQRVAHRQQGSAINHHPVKETGGFRHHLPKGMTAEQFRRVGRAPAAGQNR